MSAGVEPPAEHPVEDVYPLSPLQHGMLFHTLQDPGAATYLSQLAVPVDGDADDLAERWQRMVDRHPVLRTAVLWEGIDEPVQVVYRSVELPVTRHDWRGVPADEQAARLREFLAADRARGFVPDRAPLARLAVLRTADRAQHLVWTHHALVLDGWSTDILLDELVSGLPDGPTPIYRHYIQWLGTRDKAADATYWRSVLGDVTAATPLPSFDAESRETRPGIGGAAERTLWLTETETDAVRAGLRSGALPLVVLAEAAWALTLARLGRADTAVFGLVTSGRTALVPGVDRMVGQLANTVPVRIDVDSAELVAPWLTGLRDAHGDLMTREHTPLYEARRHSGVPDGRPLFETVLVVQNFPTVAADRADVADDDVEGFENTHYPLTVTVVPRTRTALRFGYDTAAFDRADIAVVGDCLRRAMLELVADPSRPVRAVPVLAADRSARQRGPDRSFGSRTVSEVFAAAVAADPDGTAVAGPEPLTYRGLDERVGRLAAALVAGGIRPEDRVGVVLPRGIDEIVAMLAVMRAGGCYVPVDPDYPPARVTYMLDDADCALVLTTTDLAARAELRRSTVWCLDDALPDVGAAPDPAGRCHPDGLAYVIYTSGSTGRSKGVMVSHRAVLNTLFWLAEALELTGCDVVAHKVPVSFTDAVFEVLMPLCHGAALTVLAEDQIRDPDVLLSTLARRGVTIMQAVPRQIEALALVARGLGASDPLPALRWVVNGGEPVPAAFVAAWDEVFGRGRVANVYGMTESAIFATFQAMPRGRAAELGRVPIGLPMTNTRGYPLNREGEQCPTGVSGELHLAGTGLARGYLGRPGLTAERFVPDPFGPPGSRMYRTGDVARWLADGALDMTGRVDHQVKVRGVRVEPAEVEDELRAIPGVRDAVVLLRDERLVGYLVPTKPPPPDAPGPDEIRDRLRQRLPGPMVPSVLHRLTDMPLTHHGKVDRTGLQSLAVPARTSDGAPPRDPLERLVAGVWSKVLQLDTIGRDDDFFGRGGDSLLAIRLVSRLREILPVPYSVGHLLAGPTVAACAHDVRLLLADIPDLASLLDDLAGDANG